MAGEVLTLDALRATWTALAEPTRATITAALVAAADAELDRIDTFYPASYGDVPTVEVLAVLADPAGVRRVHFLAHHLNYNFAQSGSDWADHYVLVGDAVLDGETLGAITLTMAIHNGIREYDWDSYQRSPPVDEVRGTLITRLCGTTPAHRTEGP